MEKIVLNRKTGVTIDQEAYPSFSVPVENRNQIIRGWKFRVAGLLSGLQVVWLSLKRFGNPLKAFHYVKALSHRRKAYRNTHQKKVKGDNKKYTNLYSPGWPSNLTCGGRTKATCGASCGSWYSMRRRARADSKCAWLESNTCLAAARAATPCQLNRTAAKGSGTC